MEALNKQIYDHDSDIDVTHKINTVELHNWISHLKNIKMELGSHIRFYNDQPTDKRLANEHIQQQFEMKYVDNDVILNALMNYKNSRSKVIECQDVACDMIFIQEHEKYKRMYIYHVEKYKNLKKKFLSKVRSKFRLLGKVS